MDKDISVDGKSLDKVLFRPANSDTIQRALLPIAEIAKHVEENASEALQLELSLLQSDDMKFRRIQEDALNHNMLGATRHKCESCRKGPRVCIGHFSFMELPEKIYHPMLLPYLLRLLKGSCLECNRFRVRPELLKAWMYHMEAATLCGQEKLEADFKLLQNYVILKGLSKKEKADYSKSKGKRTAEDLEDDDDDDYSDDEAEAAESAGPAPKKAKKDDTTAKRSSGNLEDSEAASNLLKRVKIPTVAQLLNRMKRSYWKQLRDCTDTSMEYEYFEKDEQVIEDETEELVSVKGWQKLDSGKFHNFRCAPPPSVVYKLLDEQQKKIAAVDDEQLVPDWDYAYRYKWHMLLPDVGDYAVFISTTASFELYHAYNRLGTTDDPPVKEEVLPSGQTLPTWKFDIHVSQSHVGIHMFQLELLFKAPADPDEDDDKSHVLTLSYSGGKDSREHPVALPHSPYVIGERRPFNIHSMELRTHLLRQFFAMITKPTKCHHCKRKRMVLVLKHSQLFKLLDKRKAELLPAAEVASLFRSLVKHEFDAVVFVFRYLLKMTQLRPGVQLVGDDEENKEDRVVHRNELQSWAGRMFFLNILPVVPVRFRKTSIMGDKKLEHKHTEAITNLLEISRKKQLYHDNHIDMDKYTEQKFSNTFQFYLNAIYDSTKLYGAKAQGEWKGIRQLLEKKEGLFRRQLMSSRVNQGARSVISPDPSLECDEILVPQRFASVLTFPEAVNKLNLEKMKQLVRNGPTKYPGAARIIFTKQTDGHSTTQMANLGGQTTPEFVERLISQMEHAKPGTVEVCRHMLSGDYVLLNRQPSLHRTSMISVRAKVLSNAHTLRFHYANCKGFNADFDGDEMNIHLPQTYEAQAEARELSEANAQFISPTNGKPIRGLIQDSVSMGVLLSRKDAFLSKEDFNRLLYYAIHPYLKFPHSPPASSWLLNPAILKPKPLWTGKQLFTSVVLYVCGLAMQGNVIGPTLTANNLVPSELWTARQSSLNERNSRSPETDADLGEAKVTFRKGHFLTGIMDGQQIGAKGFSLIHCIQELHGDKLAGMITAALGRLVGGFLRENAFSMGLSDMVLQKKTEKYRQKTLREGNLSIVNLTDEAKIMAAVNKVSSDCNSAVFPSKMQKPFPFNGLSLMVLAAAKGSKNNAFNMASHLGQQNLGGLRVGNMVSGRSLPTFASSDKTAHSKAWVKGRYLTGIEPTDYYIHSIAGRDGLIDTAVKTSSSGYLQRCLVKGLEGITMTYDGRARDSDGTIVQFEYGEDNIDPTKAAYTDKMDYFLDNFDVLKWKYNRKSEYDLSKTSSIGKRVEAKKKVSLPSFPSSFTKADRKLFKNLRLEKVATAQVQPGEAVGVIAAQSVGEPSTQMTLNTFHHAGAASAHVVAGIPRLKQLLMTASVKKPVIMIPIQPTADMAMVKQFLTRKLLPISLAQLLPQNAQFQHRIERGLTTNKFTFSIPFDKRKMESYGVSLTSLLGITYVKSTQDGVPTVTVKPTLQRGITGLFCRKGKSGIMFQLWKFVTAWKRSVGTGAKEKGRRPKGENDAASSSGISEDDLVVNDDAAAGGESAPSEAESAKEVGTDGGEIEPEDPDQKEEDDDDEANNDMSEYQGGPEEEDDEQNKTSAAEGVGMMDVPPEETQPEDEEEEEGDDSSEKDDNPLQASISKKQLKQFISRINGAIERSMKGFRDGCMANQIIIDFDGDTNVLTFTMNTSTKWIQMPETVIANAFKNTIVHGDPEIKGARVIFNPDNKAECKKVLELQGGTLQNLINVISRNDMDKHLAIHQTYSSDITDVIKTFGVEAAYQSLKRDISSVFKSHNVAVDYRHISLIADYMLGSGSWKGFNRRDLIGSSASILHKMTFETSVNYLFESVLQDEPESLQSISSQLIVGKQPTLGTGAITLVEKPMQSNEAADYDDIRPFEPAQGIDQQKPENIVEEVATATTEAPKTKKKKKKRPIDETTSGEAQVVQEETQVKKKKKQKSESRKTEQPKTTTKPKKASKLPGPSTSSKLPGPTFSKLPGPT